ncbi:hypothetical protein M0805_004457 [Coniferiporia weirii]|nr:hypothetical protein M0805_004457 [Coniferiporia weirii]
MGRSAKLHKRVKKTASSVSQTPKASVPGPSTASKVQAAAGAKRKAGLKDKAAAKRGAGDGGHVLGGADYVDLMMGSRRRAQEEARKLPAE